MMTYLRTSVSKHQDSPGKKTENEVDSMLYCRLDGYYR